MQDLLYIKANYKGLVTEPAYCWYRIDELIAGTTENPKTDPQKYKNLTNDRGGTEDHLGNRETIQ